MRNKLNQLCSHVSRTKRHDHAKLSLLGVAKGRAVYVGTLSEEPKSPILPPVVTKHRARSEDGNSLEVIVGIITIVLFVLYIKLCIRAVWFFLAEVGHKYRCSGRNSLF